MFTKFFIFLKEYATWPRRDFDAPSPHFVKQSRILKNSFPEGTWVESGTYFGDTTRFLGKKGVTVYSIEPQIDLYKKAKNQFQKFKNIIILQGLSEEVFPELLPRLKGDINFWLDGHYSAGITFKGPIDTPILKELDAIENNLRNFRNVCIMIDDIRVFNPEIDPAYPSIDVLVDWARLNSFTWKIEHDIFIAKRYKE